MAYRFPNNFVNFYTSELTSRILVESGITSDRFHLGKIIYQSLQDIPDRILQIDGGTGEQETNGSVLARSVQCARAFRKLGLQRGDVIVLMAPNHLDICIPFYAALFLGIAIATVDRALTIKELEVILKVDEPKIIFCQNEKSGDIQSSLDTLKVESRIVTFDEGPKFINFTDLLIKYGNDGKTDKFRFSHTEFPTPTELALLMSPMQWLSAIIVFCITPMFTYTRLQSSLEITQEHTYELINKYKPTTMVLSPTFMKVLLRKDDRSRCDFSSFKDIHLAGSAVSGEIILELRKMLPSTNIYTVYGMSECSGPLFITLFNKDPSAYGPPLGIFQCKLVDVETGKDVTEPNVNGEMWIRGLSVTKGYYKNPEATKEAFADGNWIKSGDLFYRDENWNFFFVERIKFLLKYKSHHVSPTELENLIRTLPDVLDVAVTGVPNDECGDLPVACVIRRPGSNLTAAQIKQLVKYNLSDTKQLRGGVVFLDQLPLTPSKKVHKKSLNELIKQLPRE